MPKRKHEEEPVNQERWLITYSDLITLLLIFFIILFSMSTIDKQKFQELTMALDHTMSSSQKNIVMNQGNAGLIAQSNQMSQKQSLNQEVNAKDTEQLDHLYQEVKVYIQQHSLENNMSVANENIGVQITMKDVALFSTGSDQLTSQAQTILNGIVPFLQEVNNNIDVAGYTDNQPISTAQFPSNWELSAMRAINVVHYLSDKHVDPSRLAGIGYGPYHPVASNATAAGRQDNRRVSITVLRKSDDSSYNPNNTVTSSQSSSILQLSN